MLLTKAYCHYDTKTFFLVQYQLHKIVYRF